MINMATTPATASQAPVSQQQINRSKVDNNFDGYLIFDFHEFQGLISQPDSNLNDDLSPTCSKQRATIINQNGINSSQSMQKFQNQQDNVRKFSVYNQVAEDQEDDKKSPTLHIQNLDLLDKAKDKTNYDEFYTFLMGLDFLNISNTRNRVDPILMDQFESLLKIKEYFVMLKNHIERITENDSDLWFDELKNTFKLMLHQFENMINSISEQINPVSLSVCFFRCIEFIKFFEQFLHMRTFYQQNTKGQDAPSLKFRRSVRMCLLWKKLTGHKTFEKFIEHLDSDPFNCQKCDKCKKDMKNQLLQNQQQYLLLHRTGEKRSSFMNQQDQPLSNLSQSIFNMSPKHTIDKNYMLINQYQGNNTNNRSIFYLNAKIFKDIQEGFSQMLEKEFSHIKTYTRNIPSVMSDKKEQQSVEFHLAKRGNQFRNIVSPVCNSFHKKNEFFIS